MKVCPQKRGNVGNAMRAVDTGQQEVVDAGLRLVAAGPHLVVRDRGDATSSMRSKRLHVAVGRRVERDRDVPLVHVDEAVFVDPVVAPLPVLGHLLLVRGADVESDMSPHRARSMRGPCSRIRAGSRSCHRCGGSTTWSSTLMMLGISRTARALHSASGSCCRPESKPPCLRMNVVDRRWMRHPSAVRRYSSLYQPSRIACVCWSMKTKCCMPGGAVAAVELDDRHVADELAARCGFEQRGKAFERVRGAERVVFDVGGEHVEPSVLDELARVRHVPGAQRVQFDEVGGPVRVVGHSAPRSGVRVTHSQNENYVFKPCDLSRS